MSYLKFISLQFFLFSIALQAAPRQEPSPVKLRTLYNSLDLLSIPQHLSFYELYPNSNEGQLSLQHAYKLLSGNSSSSSAALSLPPALHTSINTFVGLLNKQSNTPALTISEQEFEMIERLAKRLPNRKLAGFRAASEEAVLNLPSHQIDLARGVLLSQLGNSPEAIQKIRSYEATIDLMALQILTRIGLEAPTQEKIQAINYFIFVEMGFRFPPHSVYAKDIDVYTFLPSVLDSRRGVCLGVSILYICLAQRLNLNLEIVTPPGHIYVRCRKGADTINIETTARGIHIADKEYLGVNTRKLQERNLKETIGMAHFNQASVFLERKEYSQALASYKRASQYLPSDKQLCALMGYTALLEGNEQQGRQWLQEVADDLPDHAVSKETIAEDYLKGNISAQSLEAYFLHVDETRESLLKKRAELEKVLTLYPRFREGILSLAGTWLQLHRNNEGLKTLLRYHAIDPNNASVEYFLAALYTERMDYNNAWKHLHIAEQLAHERNHSPEALETLRKELISSCPE